jgi:hypothetical protein
MVGCFEPLQKATSASEGHETPYQFIITIDGEQVFSAPIGGKEDHDSSGKNITISREEIDKRMTSPKIKITAGSHDIGFTWIERPTQEQNVWQPVLRASLEAHNPSGIPRLRSLNIEGPYNVTGISETPSRQKLFVCRPTSAAREASCAAEIFSSLARRAFRRPVIESDVEAPMAFYNDARKNGGDFNAGIRAGVARILASPSFVFRVERDPATLPPGSAHRISDLELATRLSFFLWSSIPDDELLNLAIAGRLREPRTLEAQVRRMIADERSDSLMTEFTGQWLQLRNLNKVTPDLLMFPDFDDNLRQAFPPRNRIVLHEYRSRQPQCAGPAGCGLHVRERTSCTALRNSRCLWRAFPARSGERSQSSWTPGAGKFPGTHFRVESHIADYSRKICDFELPECSAVAASAKCAATGSQCAERQAVDSA